MYFEICLPICLAFLATDSCKYKVWCGVIVCNETVWYVSCFIIGMYDWLNVFHFSVMRHGY